MDHIDFNHDQFTGDAQESTDFLSPSRLRTPDPAERDPVLEADFETSPWAPPRGGATGPSQETIPNLLSSIEPADTVMSNTPFHRPVTSTFGNDRSFSVPNGEEAGLERPARQIREETGYDEDSSISEPQSIRYEPVYTPAPSSFLPLFTNMFSRGSGSSSLSANSTSAAYSAFPAQCHSSQQANDSTPCSVPSSYRQAPITLNDDSDDDIMIIEPSAASFAARKKWSTPLPLNYKPRDDDNVVLIKEERRDDVIIPDSYKSIPISSKSPQLVMSALGKQAEITDMQAVLQSFCQPSQDSSRSFDIQTPGSQATVVSQSGDLFPPKHQNHDLSTVLAAQKALLIRANKGNGLPNFLQQQSGNGSSVAGRLSESQAESSTAATLDKEWRLASSLTLPQFSEMAQHSADENDNQGDSEGPSQVDRNPKEDYSWIDEEDNEESDYDRWCKLRNFLKRKGNKITNEERMMLFKLERDIAAKDRVRDAATRADTTELEQDEEDPDSLFVPEACPDSGANRRPIDRPKPSRGLVDGEDDNPEANAEGLSRMMRDKYGGTNQEPVDLGLTKSGQPRKRRQRGTVAPQKRPQTAREVYALDQERREKERNKAQKKKARGEPDRAVKPPKTGRSRASKEKESPKSKSHGRGKGKGKGKDGRSKKSRGGVKNGKSLLTQGPYRHVYSGHQNNQDQVGQMILEDLMANDPIADSLHPVFHATANNPEPTISGRQVKETQFQTLFANIPQNEYATSSATLDKKKLREASKSFGYAKCKAQDGKWLIKGMNSPLYHHQLLGAQWMVQRELSSQPPHGGLLADSMGLGKTVQTLACMAGNPPGPEDVGRKVKATLIVAPAAVVEQWVEEINNHTKAGTFTKVMHYKTSKNVPRAVLEDLDIVVTSYHEVMKEFPFPDRKGRDEIARIGYKRWWKEAVQNLGQLHQISWYRVVLDEAQAIKNNTARTSLACQNLKSVYRWCLTGTPLLNRLEELFPYLRFLKANYSMDWQTFQKYFCDPSVADSYSRISTLLSYTMMRRTMKTTILNRPIVTLPPAHPEIMYINFSPEEQIIYRITENRFRTNLNTYFARGEARRNYGVFMVQLLRLRQCTSHPFMLEKTIRESWTAEDVAELRAKLAKLSKKTTPFYEQCQLWVEKSIKDGQEARNASDGDEYNETADKLLPFGQSNFGHEFSFDKALKSLSEKDLFHRITCLICSDIPTEPMQTDCGHIFCQECLATHMNKCLVEGDDVEFITCPSCNRIIEGTQRVKRSPANYAAFELEDDEDPASSGGRRDKDVKCGQLPANSQGRDALGFEPFTSETWVRRSDMDDEFPLTASAKTTALKSVLLRGFADAPLDKVVIYVQFRTLARIVGRICKGEGWGFLYLTGDSSLEHRTKAIRRFRDDENIKILIAGLKCGGLGLNFPWANRCISLDLWWNHAVEQQAFGRIFRIGQGKETYMTRIVVKNTVDMRMLTMQLHKLQSLEKAIRDGDHTKKPTLSLKQLANLFGFLKTDADDNIVSVEADYVDDDNPGEGSSFENGDGYGRNFGGNDSAEIYGDEVLLQDGTQMVED